MGGLWWVVGFGCGGLVLLAVGLVVWLALLDRRKRKRVLEEWEHTTGWLVQANMDLFEEGVMDLPALVLISPDKEVMDDERFLSELADRIMELKGVKPDECDDEDEALVAKLMSDETYVEGKRDKLPKRFAKGRRVYLAHIFVYRDDLPGKRIKGRRIPCAVIWDDAGSLICTRPAGQKGRRREEDEDE